jgi:hypothetical protein
LIFLIFFAAWMWLRKKSSLHSFTTAMASQTIIAGPPACGFLEDGYIVYKPSGKYVYLSTLDNTDSGLGTWTDAPFDAWITQNLALAINVCDMVGGLYVMEVSDIPDSELPFDFD